MNNYSPESYISCYVPRFTYNYSLHNRNILDIIPFMCSSAVTIKNPECKRILERNWFSQSLGEICRTKSFVFHVTATVTFIFAHSEPPNMSLSATNFLVTFRILSIFVYVYNCARSLNSVPTALLSGL
jgi:hypothetical protein